MAFDGIVVANVIYELRNHLLNGRVNKIAQPEKDELILTIKGQEREQYKLLLSAGAGGCIAQGNKLLHHVLIRSTEHLLSGLT